MKLKEAFIIFFISLIFTLPFFQKGYFSTDDGEWSIVRLAEMGRELRDFQFPPRWSDYLNHGYGYPLFLFTYPLPYYLGEIIHFLGFGLTDTIKILFVASVVISGFGMYFFSKRYWGNFGAIISSIFYIIVPYRLTDLYIRGSIGECLSLAITPWLFWSIDKYIYNKYKNGIIITILFSLLILSHNVSALLFSILIFFYLIFILIKDQDKNLLIFKPFLYGLFISCYFWLPALWEKKYIYLGHFPISDIKQHFVTIAELLIPHNGYSIKPPLFLGYPHILVFALAIVIYIFLKKKGTRRILLFFLIASFLSILVMLPISSFLWKIPGFSSLDFPWRTLIISAFSLSFISGSITSLLLKKKLGILILILAIFIYFPYVRTKDKFIKDDSFYITNDATTTSNDELMPIWVKIKPTNRYHQKINYSFGQISDLLYSSNKVEFQIISDKDQQISINTLYFPGWKFWTDKSKIEISPSRETGLITFKVPAGIHLIKGKFVSTPIRIIADIASVYGVVILLIEIIKCKKYTV